MSTAALRKAIDIAGGQTALAKLIGGVNQRHIWNWLNRDKQVPAERVLAIEAALEGRVSRNELRPDIYPDGVA